ncbi:MAG: hypothetical protein D6B25_04665, partial [Desulfobulbaceae bacterium]
LKIPQPVIADLVQKSLPMQLDTSDYQMIGGIITIQRITDIQLKDGALFAKAWIDGSNVSINTEIAGHQLRLNVGNARLSFNLRSEIRYVQGSRLLYIRPEITEMHTSGNQSADQLQGLLASLLSSREYPLSLENLSPLTVNTINKQLLIHMNVEHVLVKPGKLVLRLSPHISEQ